jgi:hypothetical protein
MADENPVGYRKPPKGTRFTKGKSGNPKGRPKGVKNLKTYLSEELNEVVTVHEGAKVLKMTKGRALIKTLLARSLKGDARAAREIIVMDRALNPSEEQESDATLGSDDVEIVETFLKNWTSAQSAASREDSSSPSDARNPKAKQPARVKT